MFPITTSQKPLGRPPLERRDPFLRVRDDVLGEAREPRAAHAEALLRRPRLDLIQQRELLFVDEGIDLRDPTR